MVKNPPTNAADVRNMGSTLLQEGPLEEGMATHFSSLAWRIPWIEETGKLQSMGSQRVGHNLVIEHTHTCKSTLCINPLHLHEVQEQEKLIS